MIDYEKLKIANELAKKIKYETRFHIGDNVNASSDFGRFFFSTSIYFDNDVEVYSNLDELIARLQELTQSKPKYEVNQLVWYLDLPVNKIHCGTIAKVRDGEYVIDGSMNGTKDDYTESELYPTKQSLIEAQCRYWGEMLCKENGGTFDGVKCLRDEYCQVSGAKLGKISSENLTPQEKSTLLKVPYEQDSIAKCQHGITSRNCYECVLGECQHESDGAMRLSYPAQHKCKKCREFYR